MLWPYSGSTCITMERSIKTTLRLRALARGPVWICQSFLQGSTLGESEEKGERERQMEVKNILGSAFSHKRIEANVV